MTNQVAEQLRQTAAGLLKLADELDRRAAFPGLLSAAAGVRMNVKRAADASGLSARTLYRLAPQIGERDGRAWIIDAERLAALLARRGDASPAMAKLGEADRCFASSHESLSTRKDTP